jgi:hypothetical protein
MEKNEKVNSEKMFQEGDFGFPFRKFEKMAEMMRNCCKGESGMADCCSTMKRMMRCGEEEETTKKKNDPGQAG